MKTKKEKKSILAIKNLHVDIGDAHILKGINLTLKKGEVHIIMGQNGSGKSTLLYAIMGHPGYVVTRGSITLDEKNILSMKTHQRALSGLFLAFQQPYEFSGLPFANVVRTAKNAHRKYADATSKGVPPAEFAVHMKDQMSAIDLNTQFLYRSLNEGFSGGEKKKAEVLQMMMLQPSFAFLDEIDSGLDVDAIKKVCLSIKRGIKEYDTGIILVTHNPRILSSISPDHVHVMVDGKIITSGGKELADRISHEGYTSFIQKRKK